MNVCSAVFVSLVALSPLAESQVLAQCRETTLKALKEEAAKKGPLTLVFFASWCPTCKDSFAANASTKKSNSGQDKVDANIYYVAAFDRRPAAEKVAKHYGIAAEHCIFDQSEAIARELGVDGVPATRVIKG